MVGDDDFLSRWSQRKAEARKGDRQPDEADGAPGGETQRNAPQDTAALDPEAVGGGLATGEEVPPELADVDIEALGYESDFKIFMKDNVPDALRRRALRQLWRSNPILANVDGLNDYDDDFTDAALVVKGLKSAYQVGKGYLTADDDETEAAEEEAAAASADEAAPASPPAEERPGTGAIEADGGDEPPADGEPPEDAAPGEETGRSHADAGEDQPDPSPRRDRS